MFKECGDLSLFEDAGKDEACCYQYNNSPVYFLLSRRGDALEIHVKAVGRKGKLKLREAAKSIVNQAPKMFPWCKMLIAPVAMKSVYNLCINVGFVDTGKALFEKGEANVMVVNYEFYR